MPYNIWLDDLRECKIPFGTETIICKNYEQFVNTIEQKGIPTLVSFDHDLGEEKNGFHCALYLLEQCLEKGVDLPYYYVHSANPVGKQNILQLFSRFEYYKVVYSN